MSDTKISDESAASTLAGTEVFPGVQSGGNVKITIAQVLAYIKGAMSTVNGQTGTTYTYLSTDIRKLVTHSNASAIAATLPQATSSFGSGFAFFVQNRGAGTLTITPTTSTIDGAASLVLTTGQGVFLISDGTNWFTFRGLVGPRSSSPAFSATPTLDTSDADVIHFGALTGNVTAFNLSGTRAKVIVVFRQDGTGGRTVAAGTTIEAGNTVVDFSGLASAASAVTVFGFVYNPTSGKFRLVAVE